MIIEQIKLFESVQYTQKKKTEQKLVTKTIPTQFTPQQYFPKLLVIVFSKN